MTILALEIIVCNMPVYCETAVRTESIQCRVPIKRLLAKDHSEGNRVRGLGCCSGYSTCLVVGLAARIITK